MILDICGAPFWDPEGTLSMLMLSVVNYLHTFVNGDAVNALFAHVDNIVDDDVDDDDDDDDDDKHL